MCFSILYQLFYICLLVNICVYLMYILCAQGPVGLMQIKKHQYIYILNTVKLTDHVSETPCHRASFYKFLTCRIFYLNHSTYMTAETEVGHPGHLPWCKNLRGRKVAKAERSSN